MNVKVTLLLNISITILRQCNSFFVAMESALPACNKVEHVPVKNENLIVRAVNKLPNGQLINIGGIKFTLIQNWTVWTFWNNFTCIKKLNLS